MGGSRRLLSPTNWVYLLIHALLFVGGLLVFYTAGGNSPLHAAIGSSLVAAGITGWVVFVYLLLAQKKSRQLEVLDELGLTDAFSVRSVSIRSEYEDRLAKARNHIDVMGFGLRALREDLFDKFREWAPFHPY